MNNERITPSELYALTLSREAHPMTEAVGKTLTVKAWALNEYTAEGAEIKQRTGVIDADGTAYITNSAAFAARFGDIVNYIKACDMDDVGFALKVVSVKSKSGRAYNSCELIFQ